MTENRELAGVPYFQDEGARYSIVPRDRLMEQTSQPLSVQHHEDMLQYMLHNGAPTQAYVIRINRTGIMPDSPIRDPRNIFLNQDCVVDEIPLSQKENAATTYLIGAVTGPYVGNTESDGEWHGMLMVARGEKQVPTFGNLTDEEMTSFHGIIGKALNFTNRRPDRKGFVGFSFSPFENRRQMHVHIPGYEEGVDVLFPRSPVQNLATIHGHVVMLDMDRLKESPVSAPEKFDQRMIREPKLDALTEIFTELVYKPVITDYQDVPIVYMTHTAKDNIFPKGAFLTTDAANLDNPRFASLVRSIHHQAHTVYEQIASVFADDKFLKAGIVQMYEPGEIKRRTNELLSQEPYAMLLERSQRFIRMVGKLKDPRDMVTAEMPIANLARVIEKFVLLGLAYNAVYYKSGHNDITLAIEPRWFSGASPLETLGIFKDQQPAEPESFYTLMESHKATGKSFARQLRKSREEQRETLVFEYTR